MCVIICCYKDKPSRDILEHYRTRNPDGYGIAWPDGKKVSFLRGVTEKDYGSFLAAFDAAPLPCLIHFRFATAGVVTESLAHPFPVPVRGAREGKARAAMAHNGHCSDWEAKLLRWAMSVGKLPTPTNLDLWSDSRALAWRLTHSAPTEWSGIMAKEAKEYGRLALLHDGELHRWGGPWYPGGEYHGGGEVGWVASQPIYRLPEPTYFGFGTFACGASRRKAKGKAKKKKAESEAVADGFQPLEAPTLVECEWCGRWVDADRIDAGVCLECWEAWFPTRLRGKDEK